jgi:peptidyl-prolyl cis-trans isomerase C
MSIAHHEPLLILKKDINLIIGGNHYMKRIKLAVGVSMLALILSTTGCNKASSSDGAILAKVNRGTITASEFKKQLDELAPQMQQAVVSDPKARKEFLDDLIGIELVLQEAKRQGLDKDAEFKKRQEMLKKELERRVQEDAKNELFNTVLKKELGDKMTKIVAPTDQEVQEYFDKNRDKIMAATGKKVGLKEIGPQLKMRMMQERRRDLYLEYAKSLKAKAKISIDDKALDKAVTALSQPKDVDLSNMTAHPAAK